MDSKKINGNGKIPGTKIIARQPRNIHRFVYVDESLQHKMFVIIMDFR